MNAGLLADFCLSVFGVVVIEKVSADVFYVSEQQLQGTDSLRLISAIAQVIPTFAL